MNAHDYEFPGLLGGRIRLADYAGRPVLVVNTASECGFTPQYAGLQRLWERHGERGLVVVGVPSNDFGGQEPGDAEQIRRFCESRYGVTFPLAAKQRVIPPDEHPFFRDLGAELGDVGRPGWNFHKYLFAGDGELVDLRDARTGPEDAELVAAIEAQLAA